MDDGHGKNKRRRGSDEAMPPPPPPLPSITYKDPIDTPKKTLFRSPTPLPKLRIDELAHPPPPSNGMGIRVYLRIRHVDPSENAGETCIFKASDTAATLHAPQSGGIRAGEVAKFSFTKVFDSDVPQQQIFEDSALPLAKGLLQRKSGLLFAYGVTNAGKTYTVVGPPHDPGVLPRTLDFLFTRIKNIHLGLEPPPDDSPAADDTKPQSPDVTYSVTISYCEIYNENIFDLLCDTKGARKKLDLKEDTENGGFYIKDMKEIQVASAEEAQNFIRRGMHNRKMANNTINADSSRSHTICTLKVFQTVSQTDGGEPLGYWSRMSIVDLAGAERNKRTGNTGERFNESNKINTSLMNLGRCLEILRSNQQHPHAPQQVIPFRNSKLTRIFRDFLLGAGQTVMVVNVNPHEVDFDETAHALKYTAVAREIVFSNRIDTHMVPMTPVRSPKKTPFATARRKPDPEPENTCEEDIDVLRRRLCETETRAARLESEIRDEVSREMAERLQEMEKMFQRRLVEEVAQREEKLRRQFDIRKRENLHRNAIIDATTPRKGSTSSGENDPFSWEIRQQYEDTISSLRERLGEQEKRYLGGIAERDKTLVEMQALHEEEMKEFRIQLETTMKVESQSLVFQLKTERKENERLTEAVATLTAQLRELIHHPCFAKYRKDQQCPVLLNGPSQGVLHASSPSEVNAVLSSTRPSPAGILIPKSTEVTTSPELRHLMKGNKVVAKRYEVVDVERNDAHATSTTTLWKGNVEKSVTGKGVSVSFTEVDVLNHSPVREVLAKEAHPDKTTKETINASENKENGRPLTRKRRLYNAKDTDPLTTSDLQSDGCLVGPMGPSVPLRRTRRCNNP